MEIYQLININKELDVIAIGNINLDFLVLIDKDPPWDGRIEAPEIEIQTGGSALNTSIALSRLEKKVGIIGRIGDDEVGDLLMRRLKKLPIDLGGIQLVRGNTTGITVVMVSAEDGKRRIYCKGGANKELSLQGDDYSYLNKGKIIHLAGVESIVLEAVINQKEKSDFLISYDPGYTQLNTNLEVINRALRAIDILSINALEAEFLAYQKNPLSFCRALHALGVKVIALKLGKDGCFISEGENWIEKSSFYIKVMDTTGAGDAFNAGLLYAILNGFDLETVSSVANAVAALSTRRLGATSALPSKLELKEFLRKTDLKIPTI